jgi:ornithine carbamoyltransferase
MTRSTSARGDVKVQPIKPATRAAAPRPASARTRSFLSLADLTPRELNACLTLAARLKQARASGRRRLETPLEGRHVALLFDKPSLRTRVTFEVAIRELGGEPILVPSEVALRGREPAEDVAKNLERWVDAVVIRTFAQQVLEDFTAAAPALRVVNALTDEEHPCQAVADVLTLRERLGSLAGRTIAYVGDGNNVATSLAQACVMEGMHVRLASPEGYALPEHVQSSIARLACKGATLTLVADPVAAVKGAAAVYTDVWTSMGQEQESRQRERAFAGYQVNEALMAHAAPGAIFMHCLPAHRGEEVSAGVLEGAASVVFDQAENRLHAQKAILSLLFDEGVGA